MATNYGSWSMPAKLTKRWVQDKVFIFYKQNTIGILVLCFILEKLKVSRILF